jgi:hypothetical protein
MELDHEHHERRSAGMRKRMATDIGDFAVVAAAAFGISFGRYLAEYKVRFGSAGAPGATVVVAC